MKMKPDPLFTPRTRGERIARAAGVILHAVVLAVLILGALVVLLSYVGSDVVFRYQHF